MNKEQLQDIFRQPYNAGAWQELLINLFGASEIRQTPSTLTSDSNEKVEGFELGRLNTADHYEIGLFAFEIKQGHNLQLNRVGLRSLVRSYTRYNVDAALVVYYDATHWRLSFICDIKEQKTAPKRYTYVFGNANESYRTASAMLAKLADGKPSFENIKSAFSVEALSKDFFKGYKEQYGKFCKYIGGEQKWQRDYVKKMMGRLVFLQFLQKKGWMGCGAAQANNLPQWGDGDLQYTQNLVKRYKGNEKLLSNILEPLFFDTLNTKRESDIADPKLGDNIKIPYLNGGLFDQDKLDEKEIDFPYAYFAELMDFFSQYNFTIDENDPNDAEVGIDPEMLGHIFENLLEDNKDKGAFYTPKEIVQYMCRQSLIEYLQSKLGKHIEIENFINNHDTGNRLDGKNYIVANAKAIEELLDNVKICDPAIGSGAFPMGVLNEIFQAKMALDMTLDRAAVKKNIIQNSIYGVDIEQGAVDIARLRFWLSLVVDEDEPQPLPNLDYKIMCGNSLLSRYALDMPFEDVFKEYNKGKSESERMSLAKYKQLVADYTNTSDHTQKVGFRKTIEDIKSAFRTELSRGEKEKFAKLKGQITDLEAPMLFGERTKKEKEDLKKLKVKFAKQEQEQADIVNNKLYEDAFEWRFEFPQLLNDDGNFVGFDIVIGNPPYGASITAKEKEVYKKKYILKTSETAILFIERGLNMLTPKGIQAYIIPKSFSFASNYAKTRDFVESHITILVDCGKAFEQVKLEACIIINAKSSKRQTYINELFEYKQFVKIGDIDKDTKSKFGFLVNGVPNSSISIADKILTEAVLLGDIATNSRGDFLQNQTSNDGTEPIVGGKDIDRYGIRSIKGYIEKKTPISSKAMIQPNSLLVQNIVAHITKPYPQIKIISCIPNRTDCYIIDTINQLVSNESFSNRYIWALLNSKLICWYVYLFIFGKAIRTMHFDNAVTDRIPIKDIALKAQQPFIEIVDKILEAKRLDPTADTTALEAQIDQMVYALYNLSYEEILIIDPQTQITQQQYEK